MEHPKNNINKKNLDTWTCPNSTRLELERFGTRLDSTREETRVESSRVEPASSRVELSSSSQARLVQTSNMTTRLHYGIFNGKFITGLI